MLSVRHALTVFNVNSNKNFLSFFSYFHKLLPNLIKINFTRLLLTSEYKIIARQSGIANSVTA